MSDFMTDEERRWWELYRKADKLSASAICNIEKQLQSDVANMDLRVQLFGYWNSEKNRKRENTEQKSLVSRIIFSVNMVVSSAWRFMRTHLKVPLL